MEKMDVLPDIKPNKKFIARQKKLKRKKAQKAEKEWTGRPALKKKTKKQAKNGKTEEKVRKAKTIVANAETGKETMKKKRAAEKLSEKKKKTLEEKKEKARLLKQKKNAKMSKTKEVSQLAEEKAMAAPQYTEKQLEDMLISQTIRGEVDPSLLPPPQQQQHQQQQQPSSSPSTLRQDLSLYPADMTFLDIYAEKQTAQVVSEDAMLQEANQYFKEVNKREREMNHAAVQYIKKLKAINRRGGDKDGFRYVVPTSVKQVVREMMAKQGNNNEYVDPEMLISNFGGDDVKDGSDRPMRKKRRGPRRHNDFYQFQVSKQWTKNAENFLRKGRANKAMFEAKKRQRSIKKL